MTNNAIVPLAAALLSTLVVLSANAAQRSVADAPFVQEYREFLLQEDPRANDVRGIAADGADSIWIAAAAGVFRLNANFQWEPRQTEEEAGPAFVAVAAPDGAVWFGAWNGLYRSDADGSLRKIQGIDEPIGAVAFRDGQGVAMGPRGLWLLNNDAWVKHTGPWANSANALVFDQDGSFWAATGHGLFQFRDAEISRHLYNEDELLTGDQKGVALAPDGALWCGGFGGIDVYRNGERVRSYASCDGLPHSDVRRMAFHPDGTLWIATALGVARLKQDQWSLRHSLRWLPDDDARDVAFDAKGDAWIATAKGVAVIRRRMMTLAEKAEHYYRICLERKVREPYIVGISRLAKQGDVSSSMHEDEDNDGEYTNHYLAMETFRGLVTGDPKAFDRARLAAETMEFFQTVTGTSGFIARTVVPPDWAQPDTPNPHRLHDRNRDYDDRQIADALIRDPRMKPVETRWRPSADGAWLWKGDTSSDELCGHFFGYYIYHEFGAQSDAERQRTAKLAARVMDYLIDGKYVLRDTDGQATRWGVWDPEMLLGNGDWRAERAINAAELLAFLLTAHHLTGDDKYRKEYLRLIEDYGFLDLARAPKATNPSERTDIDSSLLALIFPALLGIEKDDPFREAFLQGLHQWYRQIENDHNPFFNFICGAYGVEDFKLEACVDFLRDAPMDLVHWTVDNREREDLALVRKPELYEWQVDRLLPASERYTMRWDKNPYLAVSGEDGFSESTGVYWLLPYWMGRHFGFIQAPEQP